MLSDQAAEEHEHQASLKARPPKNLYAVHYYFSLEAKQDTKSTLFVPLDEVRADHRQDEGYDPLETVYKDLRIRTVQFRKVLQAKMIIIISDIYISLWTTELSLNSGASSRWS